MSKIFSIFKLNGLLISSRLLTPDSVMTHPISFFISRRLMKSWKCLKAPKHAAVVITGCDSGLGYSIALYCREIGFHVFAGVLDGNSPGANELENINNLKGNLSVIKLDVTNSNDIKNVFTHVSKFLDNSPHHYLHAVVNNAGVMIFGEFEWLTDEMISRHLNVNLLGAMNLTKVFLPCLRKNKGRIVNVSSHCAHAALPGLSVYAASKAGLNAWNDAIRVEYAKYGIRVISFLPGSFFDQSNILSKQSHYAHEMKTTMTEEALEFYGDYFNQYQSYIGAVSGEKPIKQLTERKVYQNIYNALISDTPSSSYSVSPVRYSVYHFLFRITPIVVRDYLIELFVKMPAYKK